MSIARRTIRWAAVLLPLALAGCNLGGAVMGKLEGPPVHEPKYVPRKEPMAVLVESYASGSGARLDPDQIATFLSNELREHKIAQIVDPAEVYQLRAQDPKKFHTMPIAAIGKAVGAQQILYVDLKSTTIVGPQASDSMKGTLEAQIKIVDTATGETLWPKESDAGYPLSFATPWVSTEFGTDEIQVRDKLNRSAADAIAKLFYKWSEEE